MPLAAGVTRAILQLFFRVRGSRTIRGCRDGLRACQCRHNLESSAGAARSAVIARMSAHPSLPPLLWSALNFRSALNGRPPLPAQPHPRRRSSAGKCGAHIEHDGA